MKDKKSADAIINRLHQAYGIEEKRGFGGTGRGNRDRRKRISGWRTRGVPPDKIARASLDTGCCEEWLYTGEGEIRQSGGTLHKEGVMHERHGGYRPDSLIINRELLRDILEGG